MRSWLLLASLITLPAIACPNLAGTYKLCRVLGPDDQQPTSLTIEQKVVNKIHQFKLTVSEADGDTRTEEYIADGKVKIVTNTDEETGITIKTRTNSSCTALALKVAMDATVDGETFADMAISFSKDGQKMIQTYLGESMGESVNETVNCE